MKKIILFIFTCALTISTNAQTIKDYFKTCPPEIFMSLDSAACTNISNLLEKGTYNCYVTIFGDSVSMKRPNDNYMSLEYSIVKVQLKLIDDVLVISKTVGSDCKESEVLFYDKEWNLKSSWLFGSKRSKMMPSDKDILKELLVKPDTMDVSEFERLKTYPDPLLVSAELSENTDEIIMNPSCPMLSDEEKAQIQQVFNQKTFKWTNGRFK